MSSTTIELPPWQCIAPVTNPDDAQCKYVIWNWFGDHGAFIGHLGAADYNVGALIEPGRTPFERLYFVPPHEGEERPLLAVRMRRDRNKRMHDPMEIIPWDWRDNGILPPQTPLLLYTVSCGYIKKEEGAVEVPRYKPSSWPPEPDRFMAENEFLEKYTTKGLRTWVNADDDSPPKKRKADAADLVEESEAKRSKVEAAS